MVATHGFDRDDLNDLFQGVKISGSVIKAISKPAEKFPWYRYRPIFLQPDRVDQGVKFWQQHAGALHKAEQQFGVPAEIIVAIIGVETRYGRFSGNYRVIDSLATLAFNYPKRGEFFRSELVQYLLLTREQNVDPRTIKGSYAGAMGIPQFISSSYRHYAIDFDNDGLTDIWNNPVDAIGSVGNYLKQHGWREGNLIATKAVVSGHGYKNLITEDLKPTIDSKQLRQYEIFSKQTIPSDEQVKLINLEIKNGYEFWLGMHNFYVITRYNHSTLYAMAVFQLAGMILENFSK
jgi:membrane-bound lytic murein transglycosylase B